MNKIKEVLEDWHGLEYYEDANIKKTKSLKMCNVCGTYMEAGSSHLGYKFYGEDGNWPIFVVCNKCEKEYASDLYLIKEFNRK